MLLLQLLVYCSSKLKSWRFELLRLAGTDLIKESGVECYKKEMTARLKLSRVLLIFGLDGDNNIQDPATRCFVTFLHNGRVQISTNTTNNSAGHTRGCWVLGSCLVLTKTRSQDHLPLITTCPVHHRASAELNQSGTN